MAITIEKRIRWTVLGVILTTFAITATSVLVANENLEASLLELDFQTERSLVLENARPGETLVWDTTTLKAYYTLPDPNHTGIDERLPEIFRRLPVPFSGEIEVGEATFLVTTEQVRGGYFYLAKDISLFEHREEVFHRFLFFLGLAVVLLGIMLARITGKRLVAPIQQLTRQIRDTPPAPSMRRVPADYKDVELAAIAQSFNAFLGELETYVKREQSLMSLASHELRTPIAVIGGALDVIEQRGGMQGPDKAPLVRMRRAADEMAANINVILKLTRRKSTAERRERIELAELLTEIRDDLARHTANTAERIRIRGQDRPCVREDPALVKMLLRNLIQNAVQHTRGKVDVIITRSAIEIRDEGVGLPDAFRAYLNNPRADAGELLSLSGLGLFIVTLICERLSWQLTAVTSDKPGATVRLTFAPLAPPS